MLGFPFDEGTVRNAGRAGAATGPQVIRDRLLTFGSAINDEHGIDLTSGATQIVLEDGGDAEGATLEDAHEHMQELVEKAIAEAIAPVPQLKVSLSTPFSKVLTYITPLSSSDIKSILQGFFFKKSLFLIIIDLFTISILFKL